MNNHICSDCGVPLKRYDSVSRIVRTQNRNSKIIKIERFKCPVCKHIHRDLPDNIFPYKQYEAKIIQGVLDGSISCETLGFEDYPCEETMQRWRNYFH